MRFRYKNRWIIVFVLALIILAAIWTIISSLDFSNGHKVKFGITFNHKYASQDLGLDWTEVYWAIINDLGVKDIRLAVPWDTIEEINNHYNFTDFEWMVEQAQKRDIRIIMAIGRRTPRWPECHDPVWLRGLDKEKQDRELLEMIEGVVTHFKKYDNIIYWQVENEPLLNLFGECPKADKNLLAQEVDLVRSLDPSRQIIITDTGELSDWMEAAKYADLFGVTMYKTVWNRFIGVWRYPWPPAYYYFKARRINKKYNLQKIIVSELQAEPWTIGDKSLPEMDLSEQLNLFSQIDLKNNLNYVKRAGFGEAYLWGVEWWYWLAKEKDMPQFWNEAKKIWQE